MILIVSCIILLVFLLDIVRKHSKHEKLFSEFPGPRPLPVIGNAFDIGLDAEQSSIRLLSLWKQYGCQTFKVSYGFTNWVILADPANISVLLNHTKELAKPDDRNTAMIPYFGHSLSTSVGDRWRSTKKLYMSSLNFKNLPTQLIQVNKHCSRLLEQMNSESTIDVYHFLRPYMFDVLSDTLMGVEYNLLDDKDNEFMISSRKIVKMLTRHMFSFWRIYKPLHMLAPSYYEMKNVIKTIRDMSSKILNERKAKLNSIFEEANKTSECHKDEILETVRNKLLSDGNLLDIMLLSNSGYPLNEEMIKDEISLICFTGVLTPTLTMSHTLWFLAQYPEIQQKVFEEQLSIFTDDMLRIPTMQDLKEMKYLDCVVKESIRLIPTLTKMGRQLQNDLQLKDGKTIPTGSVVLVLFEALYQNKEVYDEPEKFNPDRFLEDKLNQFSFLPFSAGPRSCVGFRFALMAVKSTLSNLIRRYLFDLPDQKLKPKFVHRLLIESTNGIHLQIKKR